MVGDGKTVLGELDNESLILLCRENDEKAVTELIARFAPSVRKRAASFAGSLKDDLAQEGFLALLDAVRKFTPDRGASFGTFAQLCIRNRMINVYKSVSTDYEELPEDLDRADTDENIPENIVVQKAGLDELYKTIADTLSNRENDVFMLYISGIPYQEIADRLGMSRKAVDNAVQRMRKKLREVLR